MEEKKNEDRNETGYEEVAEEPEVEKTEERRGLFGAKKRERNEKMITVIYAVAGVYLLYTAYMTAKELIEGKVEPGRDTIINVVFTVIFVVAAVWILLSSWKMRKMLKEQEAEEARKLAEEMAERGETPEEPAKGGLLGGILTPPQQSSVASRAAVYYNPADDEEDESQDEEEAGEEVSKENEEKAESKEETSGQEADDQRDSEQ
ncbi:MAG: hypothetical protein HFI67_10520 [Lachnospiraceae bacterium]|nr:hypothetical protein [Lachnospiraceae bacterium]